MSYNDFALPEQKYAGLPGCVALGVQHLCKQYEKMIQEHGHSARCRVCSKEENLRNDKNQLLTVDIQKRKI